MPYGLIGFLSTGFVGMTILNRIMEGRFISATDVSILNKLTIFKMEDIGLFSIPIPNMDFISGVYHMAKFDYSFFGGNAQIIQFFLYSVSFVVGFILFITLMGILYNVFRAR